MFEDPAGCQRGTSSMASALHSPCCQACARTEKVLPMSTRVCCICRWVGAGALVYCCRRIQEQIVCRERYAQPHPESSNLSCV